MRDADEQPSTGFDRRSFLTRAAAGAGAAGLVWSAPAILRTDAAFGCPVGSPCTTTDHRLNWSDYLPGNCFLVPSGFNFVVLPSYAVTVTTSGAAAGDCFHIRTTDTDCNGVDGFPRGLPTPGTGSGPAFAQTDDDFFSLYRATGTNTSSVSATFAFKDSGSLLPRAANGVTFAIGDIDEWVFSDIFNGYRDLVTITAVDGDGVAMTAAEVAAVITVPQGSVLADAPTGGNPFTGQSFLESNSNATVVVRFNCLIRSFTVSFTSAVNGVSPQWIAISDILWCAD